MKSDRITDTYKLLYFEIIEELLGHICDARINYCVDARDGEEEVPIAIWRKFEEYKEKTVKNMSGDRLDRHKLASCICGAIIEIKPLVGYKGAVIARNANEILALHVGLNIIKAYMMYALIDKLQASKEEKQKLHRYLKENFDMQFPENICDLKTYDENFSNALYWSHSVCGYAGKECFRYDIWAYSKIFYHLELYNREYLQKSYEEYCGQGLAMQGA